MECSFWVGQKVVCVDAANSPNCRWLDGEALTDGAAYTVSDIFVSPLTGNINLALAECPRPPDRGMRIGYHWRRFRPATDITIFHETVAKARKDGKVTV